ncbi:MAG TPA: 16S rRNA processing protein RimM [Thermodesulfobacteriaceae bacterium]|nr:16S rRNA processing protein RimM [Thermodesulfobacteriaceae bacterium]
MVQSSSLQDQKKRSIVLRLSGIENRLQADALAGIELYYPKADLPPLAEGEYYWHQLEGIEVADSDGNILGTLLNIIEAGYHDVYVVKGDPGEILIPATKKMVKKIDVDRGLMIVDLPPGLIEANAF